MTSLKENSDVTVSITEDEKSIRIERKESKDLAELPPSGTSLHKRRRGEPPESLSVKSPQTPSDAEGSSPCTAGPSPPDEFWTLDGETPDPEVLCESMLQRLKDQNDALSKRGKEVAQRTKDTVEALDQLEKLLELLDQFVTLKDHNARILRRLKDVNHLKRLHSAHKKIDSENEKLKSEYKELELINEALDAEFECEYGQILFDSMMMGGRSMKRSGSKWKTHSRFGGSLLRKQRSRSAGGDESDVAPGTPLRRRSEGLFMKEVEKSKVSKWTRVKAAFRWEKAQWPAVAIGGAASAVAAGAMVGAVALAGSSPSTATLTNPEPRDSASLTPGSAISLTPNSSCEELRDTGIRKSIRDDGDTRFLHLPPQDDSSTSPSPNKLHKSPWGKMRDIIQTHRESVKKKTNRGSKSSPDVVPKRRRSLSDGGDSDAPPALTLTIPSSEELESEPSHPVLRKQRSLELGARPPQHRPPRASKWTKVKRAFLTSASASVPSSPNRHSAFFTDAGSEIIPMFSSFVILVIFVLLAFTIRYHRAEFTVTTILIQSIWMRNCRMACLKDEPDLPAIGQSSAQKAGSQPAKAGDPAPKPGSSGQLRAIASKLCDCDTCPCPLIAHVSQKSWSDRTDKATQSHSQWGLLGGTSFYQTLQDAYNTCVKPLTSKTAEPAQKRISVKTEGLSSGCEASVVRDEIARDYAALQLRLRREFSDRRGKLYAGAMLVLSYPATACSWPRPSFSSLERLDKGSVEPLQYRSGARPVATEEQLSADFRKKLAEWQLKKGVKQPLPVPARQDLSEDFLRKWDEWKRMKETNSVPAWEEEAKPDEVLVQTSTGLFKFQGISRSFTRKLHEWEKSRGIAPEASTSALLRAARARTSTVPQAPLTRTQSDGSVAPSASGSGRLHASSLSVNDADDFDSEYEREHSLDGADDCDGPQSRGAVLVEVEDEEICTAAPLVAVSPRHTPQKPVYTYGQAEARLLCETSSAVTGTAVLQPNGAVVLSDTRSIKSKEASGARPKTRDQTKLTENKSRRKINRQPSIEEDAMFIRKTIQEIERCSSSHFKEKEVTDSETHEKSTDREIIVHKHYSPKLTRPSEKERNIETKDRDSFEESKDDFKIRDVEKTNGKKKSKSRARLEREQSKPSESDTEHEVDTVTVEIPRRRKRPRRASEKPRTPPTSLHSDSEGEVFVLKLKASEQRNHSPEVIVKTTRKIFSPVVRSGETIPRAVIPVNVEDLPEVRPSEHSHRTEGKKKEAKIEKVKQEKNTRSKSSGDLHETEEVKKRTRPPLPSSPSSQRKPQPKETAPSIRIMIQRYNKKINEEGTSPVSSGASSPAWRSPSTERRRPPDMPIGVNIRNNPFLEREVQKSASACQLSRRDPTSAEKRLTPIPSTSLEGVLKSHSANALHPEQSKVEGPVQKNKEDSQETITGTTSTDTIVPDLTRNIPDTASNAESLPVFSQISEATLPSLSSYMSGNPGLFGRSISTVETPTFVDYDVAAERLSERAAKIKAAREKFLSSTVPMRREGTSSASDLRPGDRSSRISCESDVAESQSSGNQESGALGRSASTGMVNVDREAWQRVAEGSRREGRSRSRFSLARLAAKLRRRDEGAVSRLCRQSLLVQLINKH